jgi:hypothetical protein
MYHCFGAMLAKQFSDGCRIHQILPDDEPEELKHVATPYVSNQMRIQ